VETKHDDEILRFLQRKKRGNANNVHGISQICRIKRKKKLEESNDRKDAGTGNTTHKVLWT